MSSIVNEFRIFNLLPQNIRNDIKIFHVIITSKALCITNDDQVYAVGKDMIKCCGYDTNVNKNYVLISELCNKQVQEFYLDHVYGFAKCENNEIYSYGRNDDGQLTRKLFRNSDVYQKPSKCEILSDLNIVNIDSTNHNCLALTDHGEVYAWGTIIVEGHRNIDYTPFLVDSDYGLKERVKSIACYFKKSIVLSVENNVYISYENEWQFKYIITMLNYKHIRFTLNAICGIHEDGAIRTVELKNEQGDEQIIKNMKSTYIPLDDPEIVIGYFSVYFPSDQGLIELKLTNLETIVHSKYKKPFDYYLFEIQSTYKTIHIKNNGIYVQNYELNENTNSPQILIKQKMTAIYEDITEFNHAHSIVSFENNSLIEFGIFRPFSLNLDANVKYYYQIGNYTGTYSVIFVTNNNKVFGFGYNDYGILGLGHDKKINEFTQIPELCNQNIVEFFDGFDCIFARSSDNRIFGWGRNQHGQLCNGKNSYENEFFKPFLIEKLSNKSIIHICSTSVYKEFKQYLSLSSDGSVYGWGSNNYGQINRNILKFNIYHPDNIYFDNQDKFKYIDCVPCLSVAVTVDGKGYVWGDIKSKLICYENVNKIKLTNVDTISRYWLNICVLKNDRVLQICDENSVVLELDKVDDISLAEWSKLLIFRENIVYVYKKYKNCVEKTYFTNFFEYYSNEEKIIKDTIHITKEGYLMSPQIQLNTQYKENTSQQLLIKSYENISDEKFVKSFINEDIIGRGAFGHVFKVSDNSNGVVFAVKRVEIKNNMSQLMGQIEIMNKLNKIFIVDYINSWTEAKVIDRKICNFLYIQMELCSQNLQDLIETINRSFDQISKVNQYFIRSSLFVELIECLNHLHSFTPKVIHRDLKPQNVLVTDGSNGRFLKLCDFGLSKFFESSQNTRGVGTFKYMAPEMRDPDNYDYTTGMSTYSHKSDIYSLGVIATKLFDFKDDISNITPNIALNTYSTQYSTLGLEPKFRKIFETISQMLSKKPEERPDCEKILKEINSWTLDRITIKPKTIISEMLVIFKSPSFTLLRIIESKTKLKSSQNILENLFIPLFLDMLHPCLTFEEQILIINEWYNSQIVIRELQYEEQFKESLKLFYKKPAFIQKSLKHFYDYTLTYSKRKPDLIQPIIPLIFKYNINEEICSLAIGCIRNLIKFPSDKVIDPSTAKHVIDVTILSMKTFPDNFKIQKNGVSILNSSPKDLEPYIPVLRTQLVLQTIVSFKDRNMISEALNICKYYIHRMSNEEKLDFGTNGVNMEAFIDIMSIMEILTDDSPEICDMFVEKGGIELYLKVMNVFAGYREIEFSLLIVVYNISFVIHLRKKLVNPEYLFCLRKMTKSEYPIVKTYSKQILDDLLDDINDLSALEWWT